MAIRILYVSTVGVMMNFFTPLVHELISCGHHVDIACNEELSPVPEVFRTLGCQTIPISCVRSPFHPGTLKSIGQIRRLVRRGGYEIVHCHTPIASFCTRLACWGLPCRVIYTAHGFHFYKGAPLVNWLLYYTAEKICAPLTDTLITINREDFSLAQKKLKAKQVLYVPGVGIDLSHFHPHVPTLSREDLNIPEGNRILLSVGQLIPRKNHKTLIRAVAQMDHLTLLIAGEGVIEQQLKDLASEVKCDIRFLGQRSDIASLCNLCDLFVLPSFQEGLSVALMEAMACGKAIACSRIRGNTDLVDQNGGVFFDPHSVEGCRAALEEILHIDRAAMGAYNRNAVAAFSVKTINQQMLEIYKSQM